MRIDDYAREIVSSGPPGLRGYSGRALRAQIDGYVDQIVERDVEEAGHRLRKPALLKAMDGCLCRRNVHDGFLREDSYRGEQP